MLFNFPRVAAGAVLLFVGYAILAPGFEFAANDGKDGVARRKPAVVESVDPTPRADVRVDASLVLIPVRVTTDLGTSVTNLRKRDFRVYEDSVEQKITTFAKDDAPLSIGIVFDTSGSMKSKMKKATEAMRAFFQTANPEDEFFLVEFNDRPKLAVPFTTSWTDVYHRVSRILPYGCTSLYDGMQSALVQMKHAKHSRKAVVVISDGGDNRSRHTFTEIRDKLLEADVLVYAIGIFDPDAAQKTAEERNGAKLLDELAGQTGGRHYRVDDLDSLPEISKKIGLELRDRYLMGYTPESAVNDGKFHRVKVTLEDSKLRVNYRRGYYAPAQ